MSAATAVAAERSAWGFAAGDEIVPGRYAVRLLGGGSRYEAYLAWDDALYALVAVKVVRPDLTDDESTINGLAGEVAALASLAHPALVRAFDVDLDGPRPHLVLEYLDGPRLSTMIGDGRIDPEQLLPLGLQVCGALHYMHGVGVVHLDVKPRNIIMSGPPRLIDLSIARTVGEAERISGPTGTRQYMAPEQCDPGRYAEIGPAADVWGVGVTLYESLCGRRPWHSLERSDPDLTYPQLGNDAEPLSGVPAPLADAVMACLTDDPAGRPSAGELADRLEPLVDRLPPPRLGLFRPGGRRRFARLT